MDVSVTIECCIELCLAPCTQNPNQFIMVKSLSIYIIMKKTSFRNRHIFVNVVAIISVGAYKSDQNLRGDPINYILILSIIVIINTTSLFYRFSFCFSWDNISYLALKLLVSVVELVQI